MITAYTNYTTGEKRTQVRAREKTPYIAIYSENKLTVLTSTRTCVNVRNSNNSIVK
jgi:hypothetical protein